MCWGDVKLCQTSTGQEYLVFNEGETKTHSGNDRTENVCYAEQREMSSKGLHSLRRKATRGNENNQLLYRLTETTAECHTLTGLRSGEMAPLSGSSILQKRKHDFHELANPTFLRQLFLSKASKQHSRLFLFFLGAVISVGHISVAINTLNQSPTLSVREQTPSKTYNVSDSTRLFVNSSMRVLISNRK